MAKMERICL